MNITQITKAFSIAHKAEDNVHIVGKHGLGKTEIVKQWAQEKGFHLEVLQLPILETSDLVGMPDITETKHGKVTTFAKPEWIARIHEANANGQHAVIFLDELGRASLDIRQASLQLVLEKKVNEHSIGEVDGLPTLCIVADNPSDEYDTADFDMALEDRFMTFENVEADITEWLKYARANSVLPVISDYLAEYAEKLHWTPESDGEKGSSPRAWKKLSDGIKEAIAEGEEDFVYSIITSKVGKTVGANFFHFYNNYIDIVKPKDIIKAIGEAKLDTEKEQRAAAKKLKKVTKDIEVIAAQELAAKLFSEIAKGMDSKVLLVYFASLNKEIAASILKDWKDPKDDTESPESKYYYNEFLSDQGDSLWFIKEIVALSGQA